MTKDELLDTLTPFAGELDLVIEHEGEYYSIDAKRYGVVQGNGMGVVMLVTGETAGHLRFSKTVELQ